MLSRQPATMQQFTSSRLSTVPNVNKLTYSAGKLTVNQKYGTLSMNIVPNSIILEVGSAVKNPGVHEQLLGWGIYLGTESHMNQNGLVKGEWLVNDVKTAQMTGILQALEYIANPAFPVPGIKNLIIKHEDTGILDGAMYSTLKWSSKPMGWRNSDGKIVREKRHWEKMLDVLEELKNTNGIEVFFAEKPAEECERGIDLAKMALEHFPAALY